MSAIAMLPAWTSAGGSTSGNFGAAASVTVRRRRGIDRIHPMASAESADRPDDGTSTHHLGCPRRSTSATH